MLECIEHHPLHALVVGIRVVGEDRIRPVEANLGPAHVAHDRIDEDVVPRKIALRPSFGPATGENLPHELTLKGRMPDDDIISDVKDIHDRIQIGRQFLDRLHVR